MENTEMNKIIFFTQYWNQRVWRRTQGEGNLLYINQDTISAKKGNTFHDYLELKSLESITDEDAIEVAKIIGFSDFFNDKGKAKAVRRWFEEMYSIDDSLVIIPDIVDFIRSKGYAFRWNGLSVEELVNRNWIKLKH